MIPETETFPPAAGRSGGDGIQQPPKSKTPKMNQTKATEAEDEDKGVVEEGVATNNVTYKSDTSAKFHTRHQ